MIEAIGEEDLLELLTAMFKLYVFVVSGRDRESVIANDQLCQSTIPNDQTVAC